MTLAGQALPEVLNLGTGQARTLGELVAAVQRAVPGPRSVHVVDDAVAEPDHTLADTTRLAATLGWVPSTDLHEVVARQLDRLTGAPATADAPYAGAAMTPARAASM